MDMALCINAFTVYARGVLAVLRRRGTSDH
jgi:hypothetical protein